MENSLNTEGKKKKKQAICGSIKIVNIPSSVLQFTEQTWSQNFPKHLYEKKKAFTAQGSLSGGWEEAEWDKTRAALPLPGGVRSPAAPAIDVALHWGPAILAGMMVTVRRQLLGCSEGNSSGAQKAEAALPYK